MATRKVQIKGTFTPNLSNIDHKPLLLAGVIALLLAVCLGLLISL